MLAIALYIRDVAGLVSETGPADLPGVSPPVARSEAASAPAGTRADWDAWWSRALTTGPGAVVELQPPDFPAFDAAPAVQRLLRQHFDVAVRWSSNGRRDHAEYMIGRRLPLGELVAEVELALGRPAEPFTLRIDEVPVAGRTWRRVADAHVLVSPGLLRDPTALVTELRPVVQELA
ncbi:hypothetical protein [Modestobacter sp. SYSU DS0290]